MKFKLFAVITFCLFAFNVFSQLNPFEKFAKLRSTSKNSIQFKSESLKTLSFRGNVKGYLFFYTAEQTLTKMIYGVSLYDQNFHETQSISFEGTSDLEIVAAEYDGTNICIHLFSAGKRTFTFIMYNEKLEETGRYIVGISPREAAYMARYPDGKRIYIFTSLKALPKGGFLYSNSIASTAVALDANGKELWVMDFENRSKRNNISVTTFAVTDKVVGFMESYYNNQYKPHIGEVFIRLVDPKDGIVISRFQISTLEKSHTFSDIVLSDKGFVLVGSALSQKNRYAVPEIVLMEMSGTGEPIRTKYGDMESAFTKIYGPVPTNKQSAPVFKIGQFWMLNNNYMYGIVELERQREIIWNGSDYSLCTAVIEVDPDLNITNMNFLDTNAVGGTQKFWACSMNENRSAMSLIFTGKFMTETGDCIGERLITTQAPPKNHVIKFSENVSTFEVLNARHGYVAVFEYFENERNIKMGLKSLH